jgi:hypothetical protein
LLKGFFVIIALVFVSPSSVSPPPIARQASGPAAHDERIRAENQQCEEKARAGLLYWNNRLREHYSDAVKLAAYGAGQQLTSKFPLAGELRTQWWQWIDDMQEYLINFASKEGAAEIAAFKAALKACTEHAQRVVSAQVSELAGLKNIITVKAQELLRHHFPGSFPLAALGDALESKLAGFPDLPPNCAKSLARLLAAFALSDPAVRLVFGAADARPFAKDLGTFIDDPPSREAACFQAYEIVPALYIEEEVLAPTLLVAVPVDYVSQPAPFDTQTPAQVKKCCVL